MTGGPSLDDLSPEERAQAEAMIQEMAQVQQQIAAIIGRNADRGRHGRA